MAKTILYESQELFGFMTDFYKDEEGNFYMTRRQLGQCLGYKNPDNGIKDLHSKYEKYLKEHCKYIFVQVPQVQNRRGVNDAHSTSELNSGKGSEVVTYQRRKTYLYDEEGIYFITMKSDQPIALEFAAKVAKILKQLRKGYQVWLLAREKGKATRRTLTDAIRDNVPDSPHKKFMYKNYTDLAYKMAFGKNSKQLKEEISEPLRDKLTDANIKLLDKMENAIKALLDLDYSYDDIKETLTPKLEDKNEL